MGKRRNLNKWCQDNYTSLLVAEEKGGNSFLFSNHTQKLTLDGLKNVYNNFIHNRKYLETNQIM